MRARAIPVDTLAASALSEALQHIADNLRPADLAETRAVFGAGADVLAVMLHSVAASTHLWLIVDRDWTPIGIVGAAPGPVPEVGVPWMVGTKGLEREWVAVARQTGKYVAEMQEAYPLLLNYVSIDNHVAIDWLIHGGFRLEDLDPSYGATRSPFIKFTRTAHV